MEDVYILTGWVIGEELPFRVIGESNLLVLESPLFDNYIEVERILEKYNIVSGLLREGPTLVIKTGRYVNLL